MDDPSGLPPLSSHGAEAIHAERLEVGYQDKIVWRDATFHVRRGEFVAVIGPNGAGKTTLFRLLLGLERPRSGALTLLDKAPRRGNPIIGYVPQRHAIDSETHIECRSLVRLAASLGRWTAGLRSRSLRVFLAALALVEAVGTGALLLVPTFLSAGGSLSLLRSGIVWGTLGVLGALALYGLAIFIPANWRASVRESQATSAALRAVGAEDLARKRLGTLSGGELQRVFLAEALVGDPELLLLDEPLSNLDLRRSRELVELVAGLVRSRNVTTLLVAHDINPLIHHLDKVIYIANGKVATGTPAEVLTSERLSALYEVPVEVLHDSRGNLVIVGAEESPGGEAG